MRLSRLTILLLLAVIIAAEPVVHTHPLVPNRATGLTGADVCAICAIGADSITLSPPNAVAPVVVSYRVVVAAVPVSSAEGPRPRGSRAPPAA
jgi:hypothetical protein